MRKTLCVTLALAGAVAIGRAQTSSSYRLDESALDFGGDPVNGLFATSSSYHIRLDAIGGGVAPGAGLGGASYRVDGGLVAAYPPPGEVRNQRWTGNDTMVWDPERSVGSYSLYRGPINTLPGGFGSCLQTGIASETATDSAMPAPGSVWFYLVTARNGLAEEGTKGYQSNGAQRTNPSPCP